MSWTSCCKLTVWIRESGRILWEQRVEERCSSGVQLGVGQGCGLQKKSYQKHLSHSGGPILGLWVSPGPSWIYLQCLAADLAA